MSTASGYAEAHLEPGRPYFLLRICERLVDLVQKTGEIEDVVAEHQRHQNQVGPQEPKRNTHRPRHANLAKTFGGAPLFGNVIQWMDNAESRYIRGILPWLP